METISDAIEPFWPYNEPIEMSLGSVVKFQKEENDPFDGNQL